MPLPKIFQTSTFRFSLVNLLVFGVSMIIPFAFVYSSTVGSIDTETNAAIGAEIRALSEDYERLGHQGLIDEITERANDPTDKDAIYLLADASLKPLAGNLSIWPSETAKNGQWVQFSIDRVGDEDDSAPDTVRAQIFKLPGNELLLIGRDIHERRLVQRRITVALGWALAITLGLGLTGGVLMSRYMLRRVDVITQTSRMIVDGALSRRVPERGTGDEFDRLAENLNQMLDQIEHLMMSMRTVTDSIAHDLRSPLTHLKGRIELALRGAPDTQSYRQALESAVAETDRILMVFNSLIEMAKAESGVGRTELASLDLGAVAADVVDLYEPVAEERGLTMAASIASGAVLLGNRQLLAQAIANLVDNAIKYTSSGGTITLSIESEPNFVRLAVGDNGPGVAPADRGRVLERFVRIGHDPAISGSGLGLSLVAAVARLHRATLELSDNNPGLRVTLVFPTTPSAFKPPELRRAEAEIEQRLAVKPAIANT